MQKELHEIFALVVYVRYKVFALSTFEKKGERERKSLPDFGKKCMSKLNLNVISN